MIKKISVWKIPCILLININKEIICFNFTNKLIFKVNEVYNKVAIRGTASYNFKDGGGQDKLDFKIMIQSSKFMVPDPNGLSELLTQGALEHASSLLKTASLDAFDQILNKMSMALNFAIGKRNMPLKNMTDSL